MTSIAPATVWNGTADTTWYTEHQTDTEFTLTTPEQLAGLAKLVNGTDGDAYDMSGKTITLGADIQLNDTANWQNWETNNANLKQWIPIGTRDKNFKGIKGIFDGAGHKISGLYISTDNEYQGLFGYIGRKAVIKNVGVVDGYVKGGEYTGFLAGLNDCGAISSSYAAGTVSGTDSVGGLVGENWGTISSSCAIGSMSGMDNVGGLVGYNKYHSTISNSYAAGSVSGIDNVGGLAGTNYGTIRNSYAAGSVSGRNNVDGLAGKNYYKDDDYKDYGCYYDRGTIINSYYDMETSGQNDGYGTPKTTAEMQSQEMVDALNLGDNAERNNAWIYESGKYPTLSNNIAPEFGIANYFESGDGNRDNPYIITTKKQLEILAFLTNAGHSFQDEYISLGQDIELNETDNWESWSDQTGGLSQWTPIGTYEKPFSGIFDGAGHKISGLYISTDSDYQGLFGYTCIAFIKNVGVIAGYVKGGQYTGFLLGYNDYGTISNSYAVGNVSGSGAVGGLAGYNYSGTISNSYAAGSVSGTGSNVGGLAGYNESGTISNSYYDSETSKQKDIGKGIPKTTAEMQSQVMVAMLNVVASTEIYNGWTHKNGKYPTLSNNIAPEFELDIASYFESGDGTSENPYIIRTKAHLVNLAALTNWVHSFESEYISLGQDIELNDTTLSGGWQSWNSTTAGLSQWTPIGTEGAPFSGVFDGAGHKISGLYISTDSDYQGLFGVVNSSAVIKNVVVVDGYIEGGLYTGFLAGSNNGVISSSYATGDVSGNVNEGDYVGGLVGINDGTISNSYATCSVRGRTLLGGLVGINDGTINNSYATCIIIGRTLLGGLVGINDGTISNSYATSGVGGRTLLGGLVGINERGSTTSNCYYLDSLVWINKMGGIGGVKISKQKQSDNGTPKTTAEMKLQATFEGWDFNGVWSIDEGKDYPKLLPVK